MPVENIWPPVFRFPPVTLPVAVTNPAVLTLLPVTLPAAEINPLAYTLPVLTFAPVMLPPIDARPVVFKLPEVTFPVTDNDWPVKLAVFTAVVNCPLLAVMSAVVVMLVLAFNALSKLPLRLNPVAFKLPPLTLPVTDNDCPVKLAALTTLVNCPLLAVTSPDTDNMPPVKLVVFTAVVNWPLLAVILAVVVILVLAFSALSKLPLRLNPAAFKLPEVTLPVTDSDCPVKLAVFTAVVNCPLPPVTLPDIDNNPPVKLAALAIFVMLTLLPMTLPVTLTNPPVRLAALTVVVN